MSVPSKLRNWIQDGFDASTISFTENFGEQLVKNRLTASQIRNIFNEVKRIAMSVQSDGFERHQKDFLMLRPKLAYAAKRAGARGIDDLRKVLEEAHIAVTEKAKEDNAAGIKAFENFVDFFEAILAYHKAAGGRD
jgi:CRISPR-associated protein Csm2